jgi:hypothetical protein
MKRLLAELRRRQIYRFGVIYLAVAWLLTQITVSVEEPLNLPGWMDTLVITLLALGFPVALLLAWLHDAPSRDRDAAADESSAQPSQDAERIRGEIRFCTTPDRHCCARVTGSRTSRWSGTVRSIARCSGICRASSN